MKSLNSIIHYYHLFQEDLQNACGRVLHLTPSRFTRTNQSRTWNTGNGSPDAVSFQVDRPGISVVGVGIYGGLGHYEYEMELLEDVIYISYNYKLVFFTYYKFFFSKVH